MPQSAASRRAAALALAAAVLTACADAATDTTEVTESRFGTVERAPSAFHGTLLEPSPIRPQLTLRDTEGQPFSLSNRPDDEVTVLFFGYTHCPDVCPTTIADLAAARRQLPPQIREQMTVAFVTEDPERDTPAALRQWLDRFDSSFVGLIGGNIATKRAMTTLHLPASKRVPDPAESIKHPDSGEGHHDHGNYAIEHPGIVYVFGPGNAVVIYTGGTSPREYAEDLIRLASGS